MNIKKEQQGLERAAQKESALPKKNWIKPESSLLEIQYGKGFRRNMTMAS